MYRDAILAAAEAEFNDRGYGATRMIDVARRAGMSVGALYRHFDSKEAVFVSLMARATRLACERLEGVAAAIAEPRERITRLVTTLLGFIEEHRAMFLVLDQIDGGDRERCGALAEQSRATRERLFDVFRAALTAGIAAGALRDDVTPADQLSFVTGAMHGFVDDWIRSGGATGLADKAPLVADLTLRALGGPA